jgi:hypothetical protein
MFKRRKRKLFADTCVTKMDFLTELFIKKDFLNKTDNEKRSGGQPVQKMIK